MHVTRATVGAVAMAALLVLAGCAGSVSTDTETPDAVSTTTATPDDGTAVGGDAGTIAFYISDEENAIDDFEHLNVTVTKVGLHRASGDGDDDEETTETTEATETTETEESEADATTTATPSSTTATTAATTTATATSTATETTTATSTSTPGDEATEAEDEEQADDGKAGWVEYEVNRTVDLTELKGANATSLGSLVAPNGSYDKVFVYVDGIDATLQNGEQVRVKLPSEKLHVDKGFTVGNGQNVSFVFDISVHEAGKSGKYVLKPVISQSGTSDEVDIEDVDEQEGDETEEGDDERTEDEAERDENETDATSDLTAEFRGPVEAGEDATLKVTGADGPVANASVTVNDEAVGQTDSSGTVTFTVPADAEEIEVAVTKGDAEVELTKTLAGDGQGNPSLWPSE